MDMDGFDGISAQIAADHVLDDFCHGVTTFRFNHLLPDVLKESPIPAYGRDGAVCAVWIAVSG